MEPLTGKRTLLHVLNSFLRIGRSLLEPTHPCLGQNQRLCPQMAELVGCLLQEERRLGTVI